MKLNLIYDLCTKLQTISSTKDKQRFLIDNRCDDFDNFLKWLFDSKIVTGVDKKKLKKKISTKFTINEKNISFESVLKYLTIHNTGRDIDVAFCQAFMSENPEYFDFLTSVFTKTLKLGVDVKSINKAYGNNFIHVHNVQLGSPRDKLKLKNGERFFLTRKCNGVRCTYVNGELISRQGTVFNGLDHIVQALNKINNELNANYVFDGELILYNDGTRTDNENFKMGTGIINSENEDKSQIHLTLFDLLPVNEFNCGESNDTYDTRRNVLNKINDFIYREKIDSVNVLPLLYDGTEAEQIDEWLSYADANDWEGIMLNKNAPYVCKRTNNLIKIKSFKHSDLMIVDVIEGEGKYIGVLGAIIVEYKNNTVNVGSGFTDEQRKHYWEYKDELIGKIAEVKYKDVTTNKITGFESLQFPTFVRIREDKTEVSYE